MRLAIFLLFIAVIAVGAYAYTLRQSVTADNQRITALIKERDSFQMQVAQEQQKSKDAATALAQSQSAVQQLQTQLQAANAQLSKTHATARSHASRRR